jgi:4-amino-4-deoxy-L-arabinose transferase-like glycosyltransferase
MTLGVASAGLLLWRVWLTGAPRRWWAAVRHAPGGMLLVGVLLVAVPPRMVVMPGVAPSATMRAAEGEALGEARRMLVTGDFHPRTLAQPAILLALQTATGALTFLLGVSAGRWGEIHAVGAADLAPAARSLNAALGVATVALVCVAGRRLFGGRAGLLAGALLALSPLAWITAYAATGEALAAFVALLAFAGIAGGLGAPAIPAEAIGHRHERVAPKPRMPRSLAAAFAVGVATGVRPTLLLLAAPLIAIALTRGNRERASGGASLLAGVIGYLATGTAVLTALPTSLDATGRAVQGYELGVAPATLALLLRHLPAAVAILGRADPLLTLLGGLGALVWVAGGVSGTATAGRRADPRQGLLLLTFLGLSLLLMLLRRTLEVGQFAVYGPFLALLGGVALDDMSRAMAGSGRVRRRRQRGSD